MKGGIKALELALFCCPNRVSVLVLGAVLVKAPVAFDLLDAVGPCSPPVARFLFLGSSPFLNACKSTSDCVCSAQAKVSRQ